MNDEIIAKKTPYLYVPKLNLYIIFIQIASTILIPNKLISNNSSAVVKRIDTSCIGVLF